jgi:hypothetical protein
VPPEIAGGPTGSWSTPIRVIDGNTGTDASNPAIAVNGEASWAFRGTLLGRTPSAPPSVAAVAGVVDADAAVVFAQGDQGRNQVFRVAWIDRQD